MWNTRNVCYVGYSGNGVLNIVNNGAYLAYETDIGYNSGSSGTVTVDGSGSTATGKSVKFTNLYIGNGGSGMFYITNGGSVGSKIVDIGYGDASTGLAKVDGPSSIWTILNGLSVGYSGSGILNITNGGVVNDPAAWICSNHGSTGMVTVDGSGSTWTNSGCLVIGALGNGTLNITNGGSVSNSSFCYIGYTIYHDPSASGTVQVNGAGSTWTNGGSLTIGSCYGSNCTLSISNGGVVSNTDAIITNNGGTTAVMVNGSGSTWTNNGFLGFGPGTELSICGGGIVTAAKSVLINSYSLLSINVGRSSLLSIWQQFRHDYKQRHDSRPGRGRRRGGK